MFGFLYLWAMSNQLNETENRAHHVLLLLYVTSLVLKTTSSAYKPFKHLYILWCTAALLWYSDFNNYVSQSYFVLFLHFVSNLLVRGFRKPFTAFSDTTHFFQQCCKMP